MPTWAKGMTLRLRFYKNTSEYILAKSRKPVSVAALTIASLSASAFAQTNIEFAGVHDGMPFTEATSVLERSGYQLDARFPHNPIYGNDPFLRINNISMTGHHVTAWYKKLDNGMTYTVQIDGAPTLSQDPKEILTSAVVLNFKGNVCYVAKVTMDQSRSVIEGKYGKSLNHYYAGGVDCPDNGGGVEMLRYPNAGFIASDTQTGFMVSYRDPDLEKRMLAELSAKAGVAEQPKPKF
jgi:hypothetical protein